MATKKRKPKVEEVYVGAIHLQYVPWENARNVKRPSTLAFSFTYFDKRDMQRLCTAIKAGQISVKEIIKDKF